MIKISIIIRVYNVEEYLKQCLDSIINQSFQDIEIICIDDGSTDNSLKILQEYATNDSRFIIHTQENQGQGIARNNAIKIAKGEYIAFIDPDDWIEPNALTTLYNYAKEQDVQILQFDYKEYNQSAKKFKNRSLQYDVKKIYNYDLNKTPHYHWQNLKKNYLHNFGLQAWKYFYNTKFIKENHLEFASGTMGEDHLFTIGARLLANKVHYLNEALYVYRTRTKSSVNKKSKKSFYVFENIQRLKVFIKEHELWEQLKSEFDTYKIYALGWAYKTTPKSMLQEYETRCNEILNKRQYKKMLQIANDSPKLIEKIFSIKNKKLLGNQYKIVTILGFNYKYKILK